MKKISEIDLQVLDSNRDDDFYQGTIKRRSSLFLEQVLGLNPQQEFKNRRILLVDDQGFNIDAIKIILKYNIKLKDSDSICDTAYDGKQALEMVK